MTWARRRSCSVTRMPQASAGPWVHVLYARHHDESARFGLRLTRWLPVPLTALHFVRFTEARRLLGAAPATSERYVKTVHHVWNERAWQI